MIRGKCLPCAPPPPQPQPADAWAELDRLIRALSVDERARVALKYFTPSAIRADRLARRDDAFCRMAADVPGDAEHIAAQVHARLVSYATTAWRDRDRDRSSPADQGRDGLAFEALQHSAGAVLSVRSLRRILAPVAKKTGGNGHGSRR